VLAKVDNGRCNGFGKELQVDRIFGQKIVKDWHLSNDGAPVEIAAIDAMMPSTSSPCSRKPRRLEKVSSPITSKAKNCNHSPRSEASSELAKRSFSREKRTAVVESVKGSNYTNVDSEYA
jgi:hypothetical protein